ncbi:ester cyclase [Streptomyces sp. NPDC096153]|uniref:ester cyclase n=1 Tax=Streptomyces sp. NPDC096153 TaxID=3155548 RepID=UPI0033289246
MKSLIMEANGNLVDGVVVGKRVADLASGLVADDFIRHDLGATFPEVSGPQGVRALVRELQDGIPDLKKEIVDIVAEGDRVAVRVVVTGTHEGVLFSIPPTGKRFQFSGMAIYRIADGRIAETWQLMDWASFFEQIGAVRT